MKVGLFLGSQWPAGTALPPVLDQLFQQVAVARDSGFSSLWLAQHYVTAPLQMLQPIPLFARIAADAEGMTLGTAILLLSMQNPVKVAEDIATLDWLCGGRFVLGVGLGYREEEFASLGVPISERVGRLREAVEVIRRLWREDTVTHHGRYFRLDNVGISIKPKQPGGPPVWLAGEVVPAVKRAARLGDAWLPLPASTLSQLALLFGVYRSERAAVGLPLPAEMPVIRECYVGETAERAIAEARVPLRDKYRTFTASGDSVTYLSQGMQSAAAGVSIDDDFTGFAQNRFLIGDEAQIRDELQRYRDELGVQHFCMRMQWYGLEQDLVLKSIERLGRVVAALS